MKDYQHTGGRWWQQIFYLPPLESPLYTGISKEVVAVGEKLIK